MTTVTCHPDRVHYGRGLCKPCYMRDYQIAHRAELAAWSRDNYPRRKARLQARNRNYLYGVTPEEYRDALVGQAGRCAICGLVADRLVVDHDHATGKFRGLLCQNCNQGIGRLGDNAQTIDAAARYLRLVA